MAAGLWRNTGRRVKFWIFDAYLAVSFLLLMLSWSIFMLIVVIISLVFFYILDYKGYTLPNALRRIHLSLSGKLKRGVHQWRVNKF